MKIDYWFGLILGAMKVRKWSSNPPRLEISLAGPILILAVRTISSRRAEKRVKKAFRGL